MRALAWPVAGALGVTLLAATRVELSPDLDRWAAGPLPGEVILALHDPGGGVLVGSRRGLHRLDPAGSSWRDLGVPGPVHALAGDATGRTWLATDDGLLALEADGRRSRPEGLEGVTVRAVDARDGTVVLGADTGLHRRGATGGWERLWPADGAPATAVTAVLATDHGVLFDHPEGLALAGTDGSVEVVVGGVDVVALGRWSASQEQRLWAGTRGAPLLLVSEDGGLTWQPRADGLGFSAVHDVAADPADDNRAVAAGSGLADGTGNAGTQLTEDRGATWQYRQDRLSNTHVLALQARQEPLRLHVRLAGTDASTSVPLPTATSRWYAGTNGSGVSTYRLPVPVVEALVAATPVLRVAEPVVAGTLLLACVLPAYRQLARGSPRSPRSPPRRRPGRGQHPVRPPGRTPDPHPRRTR